MNVCHHLFLDLNSSPFQLDLIIKCDEGGEYQDLRLQKRECYLACNQSGFIMFGSGFSIGIWRKCWNSAVHGRQGLHSPVRSNYVSRYRFLHPYSFAMHPEHPFVIPMSSHRLLKTVAHLYSVPLYSAWLQSLNSMK